KKLLPQMQTDTLRATTAKIREEDGNMSAAHMGENLTIGTNKWASLQELVEIDRYAIIRKAIHQFSSACIRVDCDGHAIAPPNRPEIVPEFEAIAKRLVRDVQPNRRNAIRVCTHDAVQGTRGNPIT